MSWLDKKEVSRWTSGGSTVNEITTEIALEENVGEFYGYGQNQVTMM